MNIPGTNQPLKVYERTGPPPLTNDAEVMQRRGLLAKIHIAKKEMGLNEGEYEMILRSFKVASSADMTLRQLENMVKLLKHYGWKPTTPYPRQRGRNKNAQIEALRKRVLEEAKGLPNWETRAVVADFLAQGYERYAGVKLGTHTFGLWRRRKG